MKIIRADPGDLTGPAQMLALCLQWGIRRCNQAGCKTPPNTIISGAEHEGEPFPAFGLCEEHFQMCNIPGGGTLSLEFDDFDAFAGTRKKNEERDGANASE
jgi:hypothetical protein